jgi:hypothetical protein
MAVFRVLLMVVSLENVIEILDEDQWCQRIHASQFWNSPLMKREGCPPSS